MELFSLIVIFSVSLFFLIKGSAWFLNGAERIGVKLGLSSFVIGVLLVGIGTSLPELISSLAAVLNHVNEIVVANAVGSNIANILLVSSVAMIIGRKIIVTKDLIDLELPLFAVSTVLFIFVIYDGNVVLLEALLLLTAYIIYLLYSLFSKEEDAGVTVADKSEQIKKKIEDEGKGVSRFVAWFISIKDYTYFVLGIILVVVGAKYLISSVVGISAILNVAPGLVSLTAIAFGTSLPELFVSGRAVMSGKPELAIGNILGSNAFNALMVVSIPGLFGTLYIDDKTLSIGVPIMALSALLFIITGISKKLYHWEGIMFLILYVLFIFKLFGFV
jgi:cation:H+ antiporter